MNFRIFVEKKKEFNVEARELFEDLQENLFVKNLKNIRIVNIYDIFNIEKRELKRARKERVVRNETGRTSKKNKTKFEEVPKQRIR